MWITPPELNHDDRIMIFIHGGAYVVNSRRAQLGLQASVATRPHYVWPSRVRSSAPLAAIHTRTVPSSLPEVSCVPSGDQATLSTQLVSPSRVRSSSPLSASHIRTVRSRLAEGGQLVNNAYGLELKGGSMRKAHSPLAAARSQMI